MVANWLPFEDPGGGPNFYKFDPRARYYINIDNTGDGDYDVRYRFTFRTIPPNSARRRLPGRAAAESARSTTPSSSASG